MCIKEQYYTRGNNAEYTHLLCDLCDWSKSLSLENIRDIAIDILDHSDWEEKAKDVFDCDYEEFLSVVMTDLLNDCCTISVIVAGQESV